MDPKVTLPAEETPPSMTNKVSFESWWKVGVLVVGTLLVGGGIFFAGYQYSQKQTPSIPQPTPTLAVVVSPTPDPTANWKTYTSKDGSYLFKYPEYYKLIKDDFQSSTFGFSNADEKPYPYLTISSRNITDIKSFKFCSQLSKNLSVDQVPGPCIDQGSGWGQEAGDILDVTLDGKKAKSFYLSGGVDNAYHIIQTVDDLKLELKMYVAGGGLDKTFNQILSTFKFLD